MSSCDLSAFEQGKVLTSIRKQKTISQSVSLSGIGLFTGLEVKMRFYPAPIDTGIIFSRVDLPGSPQLKASIENIWGTPRCTILGKKMIHAQTVEHVLSALRAYDIDNLLIEIDGPEVPVGDGSALPFVSIIEQAGVVEQDGDRNCRFLASPVYWSEGDVHLVALPSKELRISYTLSYPDNQLIRSQFFSCVIDSKSYKEQIAACRTFSLYEEIVPLLENGIIKGGSLDNGVVIKGKEVLNPGGFRFDNEPVRHKVLDLIGDLSLIGFPIIAHIIAIRSGHYSNTQFAKVLTQHVQAEASVEESVVPPIAACFQST